MSPRALATPLLLALALGANVAAQQALPVDPQSGLIVDRGWELVAANCGACHSTRLVTQNHKSASDWVETIRWMQAKHKLWDLGANESKIVAYLERNYGVADRPMRRQPLNQPPLETPPLTDKE